MQCSKLRVHSASGAHISAAVRTFFGRVRPMCAHFFTQLSLLYTRGVHRKNPVRTVSIRMHPRGAQNKTLISNTVSAPLVLGGCSGGTKPHTKCCFTANSTHPWFRWPPLGAPPTRVELVPRRVLAGTRPVRGVEYIEV